MSSRFLKRWFATLAVAAACICFFALSLRMPTLPAAIRGDGLTYHLWARGMLEGDLGFCKWYSLAPDSFSHLDFSRGVCAVKRPPGVGLMELPVMALVLRGHHDEARIGAGENRACLAIGLTLLVLICMLATLTGERLQLHTSAVHIAILTFAFGTGLFVYSAYWPSYSHIYSAFSVALLVWALVEAYVLESKAALWAAGIAAFLIVLNRNIDGLTVVILGAVFIWLRSKKPGGQTGLTIACFQLIPMAVGVGAAAAIQIAYNSYAAGHLTVSSYGSEGFQFSWLQAALVLLSYDRGLLPTYPVTILALAVGCIPAKTRAATAGIAILLVIYILIYGAWHMPRLGWSFGPRGLVSLIPLLLVLFACALSNLPARARTLVAVVAACCTVITVQLTAGLVRGKLAPEDITPAMYWSVVLDRSALHRLAKSR